MTENKGRGHNEDPGYRPPDDTAAATPSTVRASEEAERPANRKAERRSRTIGWVVEALLLGWTFARGYFTKVPLPNRTPAALPTQTPAAAALTRDPAAASVLAPEKTGRVKDINLDLYSDAKLAIRERWGSLFVVCAFAIGLAAGVGFLFIYWSGGSNLLLGGMLALFLGGFGSALVLYSHWLMRHKEAIEPREKLPSSAAEREAVLEDYCAGAHDVQRRSILKWMGAAGTGLLAAMIISLMRSLGMSPYPSLFSTVWTRGQRLITETGEPVSVDSLQPGSTITVFPEGSLGSEKAQTVLVRVKEQLLQLPQDRANWAPMGYLAYSRVCTHAGCPVGMYEAENHLLLCPCHQSTFNVLTGAIPTGGPAARPLPQLPLYADSDGNLRAAGGFTAPPGPGFWGMS